jgi:hypothetical protein
VEDEADDAAGELDRGVPEERLLDRLRAAPDEGGAERHAAEEDHQDDDLRVGAVADEEPEIAAPDRLVDQAGGAGEDEDRVQQQRHGGASRAGESGASGEKDDRRGAALRGRVGARIRSTK